MLLLIVVNTLIIMKVLIDLFRGKLWAVLLLIGVIIVRAVVLFVGVGLILIIILISLLILSVIV